MNETSGIVVAVAVAVAAMPEMTEEWRVPLLHFTMEGSFIFQSRGSLRCSNKSKEYLRRNHCMLM